MESPRLPQSERVRTKVVLNVNVNQIQTAGTLDQLSKHPAHCQFVNHWLVGRLIGMDRQMENGVAEEEDK